jgi:hypothetical protein
MSAGPITPTAPFLLYATPDGAIRVTVSHQHETVWLTQKALAELFSVQVPAIAKHLKNIFESEELSRDASVSKMENVQAEGAREVARTVEFYNLDAIIAVGYRGRAHLRLGSPRQVARGLPSAGPTPLTPNPFPRIRFQARQVATSGALAGSSPSAVEPAS